MPTADYQRLVIPLRRDIAHFRHEFDELHRQFDTIRHDSHARSNNPDKQAAYKTRVLRWYYQGIPRAKHDLLQRLDTFWTAMPSAVAVVAFYNTADDEVVARDVDYWRRELYWLGQTVERLFTSMGELQRLNPKWRGARKCPLFTDDGCVLHIEPGGERAAAWIDFLEC